MHRANILELDLNLLVALDALLAEENVSRAALRIGLSQPAMSHALRRLRETFDDPLLVRAGSGMAPTPRAESLKAPLADALSQIEGLFAERGFAPATSARTFRVMIPDLVQGLILPVLMERVGREAPNVRIEIIPWREPSALGDDEARAVDLIIYCGAEAFPRFHRRRLYVDSDALAVRRGYPAGRKLSQLDAFLGARHVAVVGAGRREDMIDEWLRSNGVERKIALIAPTYLQALHAARESDLVAFVPRRLIASLAAPLALTLIEPPLDPGRDEQLLFYPTRAEKDPASIWLRTRVIEIGKSLSGGVSQRKRP